MLQDEVAGAHRQVLLVTQFPLILVELTSKQVPEATISISHMVVILLPTLKLLCPGCNQSIKTDKTSCGVRVMTQTYFGSPQ